MELSDMVSPPQAAKALGVSTQAVDYWIAQGHLAVTRTPWGSRLIERAALEVFASQRALAPKDKAGRINGALQKKGNRQAA